jgi:hypothetical protein
VTRSAPLSPIPLSTISHPAKLRHAHQHATQITESQTNVRLHLNQNNGAHETSAPSVNEPAPDRRVQINRRVVWPPRSMRSRL